MSSPDGEDRLIRTFGRVKARALKPSQERLMTTLYPRLALDHTTRLSPADLFGGARALGLEIGFGGGEHLAAQAAAHPDWGFVGAEPFLNGVGSCLRHIEAAGVDNVRLHCGDARDIVAACPDAAFDRAWILFPDPWPKTRHHKRRLIQADFIAALARVTKPGAEVRFATDWADYADWTLALFLESPAFDWIAARPGDWRAPWPGHAPTRYELKKLGDCAPIYLRFARRHA